MAAGLNYTFWIIDKGDGNTATIDDLEGDGGTLSVQLEAGLGLRLGRLDTQSEKVLLENFGIRDVELGVSVVHITAPLGWWDTLHVGDTTWRAQLTVSFQADCNSPNPHDATRQTTRETGRWACSLETF